MFTRNLGSSKSMVLKLSDMTFLFNECWSNRYYYKWVKETDGNWGNGSGKGFGENEQIYS